MAEPSWKQLLILLGAFASAVLVSELAKHGIVTKAFEDIYFICGCLVAIAYLVLACAKRHRQTNEVDWVYIGTAVAFLIFGVVILLRINGLVTKGQNESIAWFTNVCVLFVNVWNMSRRDKKRAAKTPEGAL